MNRPATPNAPSDAASNGSPLRMILALALFGLAVVVGVYLAFGWQPPPGTSDSVARKGPTTGIHGENEDSTFFYQAIGNAPEAPSPEEDAARRKAQARGTSKLSFTLELKVAASREEAEQIVDRLHQDGIEAYYTPLARSGRVVFRVRQGIFASQKAADQAALALRQSHAVEAKVVKLQ